MVAHSNTYDIWRGVLHGGWYAKWRSAQPHLTPDKVVDQMASMIATIRRGWVAVWSAYTAIWKQKTVEEGEQGVTTATAHWTTVRVEERLTLLLERGWELAGGAATLRGESQAGMRRWLNKEGVLVQVRRDSLKRMWAAQVGGAVAPPHFVKWCELGVRFTDGLRQCACFTA